MSDVHLPAEEAAMHSAEEAEAEGEGMIFLSAPKRKTQLNPEAEREPTEDELASCTRVLQYFGLNPNLLQGPTHKPLRSALFPLLQIMGSRVSTKDQADKVTKKKLRKQAINAKKQQIASHDSNLVNARALRSNRVAALEALQDLHVQDAITAGTETAGLASLPLVPDGAVNASAEQPGDQAETEEVLRPRACYTCKKRFFNLHHFYDRLCEECADLNWQKRHATADLTDRVVLVTGGRVKIGFQIVLKLLRADATVVVTTRFPHDCAMRLTAMPDSDDWSDRLQVYGIDLRDMAAVERFAAHLLSTLPRLDAIVNNACQTVRREPDYYTHLLACEMAPATGLPLPAQKVLPRDAIFHRHNTGVPALLTQQPTSSILGAANRPASQGSIGHDSEATQELCDEQQLSTTGSVVAGVLDVNGQSVDVRTETSWVLELGQVDTGEAAEVMAVNTLAPFIINGRLKPLMLQTPGDKWIVNVSAMEGKFYRYKTAKHPHTNMAKAALNMMTRTCAESLAAENIYMNSVDTGWINDENPLETAARIAKEQDFQTPIDEIDAAARVLDPIFIGADGTRSNQYGKFLKDYTVTEW